MLIGVTGQIGAGKSAVTAYLSSLGALVVDADKIGKQVTGSPKVLAKLVKIWGEELRTESGKLRPAKLAQIVFGDKSGENLKRFNQIIKAPLGHAVRHELRQAEKRAKLRRLPTPVVLDAALLPDWPIANDMDLIVLITATKPNRLKRLVSRGMENSDALSRMRRQSPLSVYRDVSNIVITNNATLPILEKKIDSLWQKRILPNF